MPVQQIVLPKINTPAENQAIVAEGQRAQQVSRDNELTLQKKQRDLAEKDAVTRVMKESGGDWEVAIPRLRQVSPDLATKYEKHLSDERASRLGAMKDELALEKTQTERGLALSRVLLQTKDPEMYKAMRPVILRMTPDLAGFLGEEPDFEALAQIQTMGETAVEALERQRRSYELLAEGKHHQAAAMAFSATQDADDWKEAQRGLNEMGAPRAVVQQFGEWSPAAPQRALQLGMTPDARADNARGDATLALNREEFGERVRSNKADEAVARGNLAERRRDSQRTAAGEAGPLAAGDAQLLDAILKNPAIYGDLTPSQKTKLAGPLAARGFTGFGKGAGGAGAKGPDVGAIFGEIRTLSKKINTSNRGPVSTAMGYIRQQRAGVNLDNDVAEYESLVLGMIPMVARAVGHTGPLTQQDVDSVRSMFPTPRDGQTLADNKLNRVEKLIGGGSAPAAAPEPAPPAAAQGSGRVVGSGNFAVTAPNGTSYRFKTQALLDEFKRRAAQAGGR